MTIKNRVDDDGYTGLLLNPNTGQVLYANAALNQDPFYIRVDSVEGSAAKVKTSKPVIVSQERHTGDEKHVGDEIEVEAPEEEAGPVIEPTPDLDVSVDQDSGEMALLTILAEANGTKDKSALKTIGASIGLKLTNNMNVSTMQSRIEKQVEEIRSASEGE